jgi:hypothetical protein
MVSPFPATPDRRRALACQISVQSPEAVPRGAAAAARTKLAVWLPVDLAFVQALRYWLGEQPHRASRSTRERDVDGQQ